MEAETCLPSQSSKFLKLEVVSWNGPVVEIHFVRPIESATDVERAVREAITFMPGRPSGSPPGRGFCAGPICARVAA